MKQPKLLQVNITNSKIINYRNILEYMYPFLKEVSKIYDELDKNIDDDDDDTTRNLYNTLCDFYVTGISGEKKSKYKDTCLKLVRNLGFYSKDSTYFNHNYDRCNILYNWIYNSIKKGNITDDIITNCYYEYLKAKEANNDQNTCVYHSYKDDYEEPENIMLLNIFKSYIHATKDIMNGENDNLKSSCQKYICEFVKIYKKMYTSHCLVNRPNDQKQKKTCELLGTFKDNYNIYLLNLLNDKDKIPSLEIDDNGYVNKCKIYEHTAALPTDVHGAEQRFTRSRGDTQEGAHTFSSQPTVRTPNPNNSISSTVSTAVGTMAGASSVLALLYKVNKYFI
ncbi:hypothetical protein PVNG_02160 [Plasmodium vivax North Korean]|uniref:Uncharacterized protein n=1 Tax=Plasmodium vivax North Korean TaxID=1035514 RepID=A0A0J9TWQ9_PLAVI|nr:hypothetical protein PVNG_02160 [Plasmodium vivax North Korean]